MVVVPVALIKAILHHLPFTKLFYMMWPSTPDLCVILSTSSLGQGDGWIEHNGSKGHSILPGMECSGHSVASSQDGDQSRLTCHRKRKEAGDISGAPGALAPGEPCSPLWNRKEEMPDSSGSPHCLLLLLPWEHDWGPAKPTFPTARTVTAWLPPSSSRPNGPESFLLLRR